MSEPEKNESYNGPDRRLSQNERRGGEEDDGSREERCGEAEGDERRSGWDRRRGPGRRRTDERRSAEEGEMDAEQFEFIMAIDEYKKANKRPFPSFTEILEVAKAMGYRKVADPVALNKTADQSGE